jgi:hypothetical protein
VLPAAPVCDGPRPVIDRERVLGAIRRAPPREWRDYDDDHVADPELVLHVEGHTVRWIAMVPVGREPKPPASDSMRLQEWVDGAVLVATDGSEVIGTERFDPMRGMDDWMRPGEDARALDEDP